MSYYDFGKSFDWFVATVEDVADPLMLGRLKIRVINDQDANEVTTDELLWAMTMTPVYSASVASENVEGAKTGPTAIGISPTGAEVGSIVIGFFLDGSEKNVPMIIGSYPKIPGFNRDKSGEARDLTNHDVSMLAREKQTLEKKKIGGDLVKEPDSAYRAKYPYNKTITTRGGHAIEIDDTPGSERIHVYHTSGTYMEIDVKGQCVKKTVHDDYEIVARDKKVYVKGNVIVEVDGNAIIDVNENAWLTVGENLTGRIGKNVDLRAGGTMYLESAGNMELKAPRIDLNR